MAATPPRRSPFRTERTVVSRMRVSAAAVLGAIGLAVLAAGCGGGSGASAAPPSTTTGTTTTTTPGSGGPNAAAFQAYRDCLSAHGVALPARPGGGQGGTPPAGQPPTSTPGTPGSGAPGRFGNLTAKQRAAMTACQSKRPAGGRGFGGGRANGGRANGAFAKYTACLKSHGVTFGSTSPSSSAFTKATAACKSLLPASTGGSTNGGTTTTTTP
jgi:hypothetical protein